MFVLIVWLLVGFCCEMGAVVAAMDRYDRVFIYPEDFEGPPMATAIGMVILGVINPIGGIYKLIQWVVKRKRGE